MKKDAPQTLMRPLDKANYTTEKSLNNALDYDPTTGTVDYSTCVVLHGTQSSAKEWTTDKTGALAKSKMHTASEYSLNSLDDIQLLLTSLLNKKQSFIVRGALNGEAQATLASGKKIRRLINPNKDRVTGEVSNPTLVDAPKKWLGFDIDDLETPFDAVKNTRDALTWAIDKHLPFLSGVGFVYKLSGSAGHPTKTATDLRAHVYVMLSEARTCAEVRAWANDAELSETVDRALFTANQIHYTADPITNGIGSRPDTHVGRVDGSLLHVPLIVQVPQKEYKPRTVEKFKQLSEWGAFARPMDKAAANTKLQRQCKRISDAARGKWHTTTWSAGRSAAELVHSGAITRDQAIAALSHAAQLAGHDAADTMRTLEDALNLPASLPIEHTELLDAIEATLDANTLEDAQEAITTQAQAWAALSDYYEAISDDPEAELTKKQKQGKHFKLLLDAAKVIPYVYETLEQAWEGWTDIRENHCEVDALTNDFLRRIVSKKQVQRLAKHMHGIAISEGTKKSTKSNYSSVDTLNDLTTPPAKGVITGFCGAMGIGKTFTGARYWRDYAAANGLQFLAITHRSSLAAELAKVLNCTNYAHAAKLIRQGSSPKIFNNFVCCINSLDKPDIAPRIKNAQIIVLDEVGQQRKAWASIYDGDTSVGLGSDQHRTYARFIELIQQAHSVLVMDAALSDDDIQWLQSIKRPDQTLNIIEHSKKSGDGLKLKFLYSNNSGAAMAVLDDIVADLERGLNVWVGVGEKMTAFMLQKMIEKKTKDIFIHSTTPDTIKNEVLADVDAASRKYQLFITSTVISSGVSVTHKGSPHFDKVYVIGNGRGAGIDDLVQMSRRVRYCKDITVATWQNITASALTDDEYLLYGVGLDDKQSGRDDLYAMRQKIIARRNAEKADFMFGIATAFKNAGFDIEFSRRSGSMKRYGEIKTECKTAELAAISAAKVLDWYEYDELKIQRNRRDEDNKALAAYELRDALNKHDQPITEDDYALWSEGYGREPVARVAAAVLGLAVGNREGSHKLVRLYGAIFKGIDLDQVFTSDQIVITEDIARRIVDNAWAVGREGVAYGILPKDYCRPKKEVKRPIKSAKRIFELMGVFVLNPHFSNTKMWNQDRTKRFYVHSTDADLFHKLKNAAIDLADAHFETTPAKDYVTQRQKRTTATTTPAINPHGQRITFNLQAFLDEKPQSAEYEAHYEAQAAAYRSADTAKKYSEVCW